MAGRPVTQPCGTMAAYQRHYQHGEDPCDDCRRARHEAYILGEPRTEARKEAHRAHSRRRYAAVKALIAMYPADFQRLLTQQQEISDEQHD
jgi:hypothetical protein